MKRFVVLLEYVGVTVVAAILIVNALVYLTTSSYIYNIVNDVPHTEAVLIPGAAILSDGTLSPIFKDRVDAAIELYRAGKVAKILASGDNSTVSHNEVNPVRTYLLAKGIPDQDIFLDHAGFDTYSSMYRASAIFGVSSLIIATQAFHLPRAVFIARKLGMEAYGVKADVGTVLVNNYVREIFADEKAVYDLMFNVRPKYLGDTIPIMGDGRDYP